MTFKSAERGNFIHGVAERVKFVMRVLLADAKVAGAVMTKPRKIYSRTVAPGFCLSASTIFACAALTSASARVFSCER